MDNGLHGQTMTPHFFTSNVQNKNSHRELPFSERLGMGDFVPVCIFLMLTFGDLPTHFFLWPSSENLPLKILHKNAAHLPEEGRGEVCLNTIYNRVKGVMDGDRESNRG